MLQKIVCISIALLSVGSVQAGLETLVKGQSYVIDGACVAENEALKLYHVLPDRSQVALSALATFEDAMQSASRWLPGGAGLKKQEALCLRNCLCDFKAAHGGARVAKSCGASIMALALAHAKVIRDFSKNEQKELNDASQIKARSCVDVHIVNDQEPVVREIGESKRPALICFRESVLFLQHLCLLANRVRNLIPEIDTLTRGQLTKKLWSDFTESCDDEEGKDTI